MAASQLQCLEDGHISPGVPENRPEFYYSENHRAAVEELLRGGDGAFKTRLREDKATDFLSAREVKLLTSAFRPYGVTSGPASASGPSDPEERSTYWPQASDVDVPPLELGWAAAGFFRGVTRVAVHTHPPKDGGPHVKEVVRRLIQEAAKVIAIVMDLLTDVQILQDLMEASWRRSVPVYILLDAGGVPHFLDMCSRLKIDVRHLRNIRARTLGGVGLNLSLGRLPGSVCSKYMLVDGDKVMFGSYSFSWSTSRMDRNTITVMTGQVVEFFDRDFRELYAVSENLDLFKEFNVSPPDDAAAATATLRSRAGSKRPPLPATTSRFQVSLGDSRKADIQIPAHKYNNPKYLLVVGDRPRPTGSLQEAGPRRGSVLADTPEEAGPGRPRVTSSERVDTLRPRAADAPSDIFQTPNGLPRPEGKWRSLVQRLSRKKASTGGSAEAEVQDTGEGTPPPRWKGKKLPRTSKSRDSVATEDNKSLKSQKLKSACKVS